MDSFDRDPDDHCGFSGALVLSAVLCALIFAGALWVSLVAP